MVEDSAFSAHSKIDTHEKVCAERYGHIWQELQDIKNQFAIVHARFNTISNRMWIAVGSVCGFSVLGLAAVVFHLLTRK